MREQRVDGGAAAVRLRGATKRERVERAQRDVDAAERELGRALVRYRRAESSQLAVQTLGSPARAVEVAKARTIAAAQEIAAARDELAAARARAADARAPRRRARR